MQVTKLEFTPEELKVLNNSHFFKVKLEATRKIIANFTELESCLKADVTLYNIPDTEGINVRNGKIFRGENYLNLPYVMLDFPRLFNTKSVFAFRSMFWWGNGYSFTFHLQGDAWLKRKNKLIDKFESLKNQSLYICVNDTPWQYHFEEDNYILLDQFFESSRREELDSKSFIKICSRLNIDQYQEMANTARTTFNLLMKTIS